MAFSRDLFFCLCVACSSVVLVQWSHWQQEPLPSSCTRYPSCGTVRGLGKGWCSVAECLLGHAEGHSVAPPGSSIGGKWCPCLDSADVDRPMVWISIKQFDVFICISPPFPAEWQVAGAAGPHLRTTQVPVGGKKAELRRTRIAAKCLPSSAWPETSHSPRGGCPDPPLGQAWFSQPQQGLWHFLWHPGRCMCFVALSESFS